MSNDACHFFYNNGYDSLGNQAYRLLSAKLYNRSFVNTRPPSIVEAFFSAPNEITLKIKNVTGNLRVIGNPWNDFKLEGCQARITSGSASESRVKLTFSGDTAGLTGISYLSHIDSYSQNWVVNPLGIGMLLFYDMPIHERQLTDTAQLYTEGGLFDISPTAVSDILNIRFLSNENMKKRIDIVNTHGQIVLTKQIETLVENTSIDVHYLPDGVYFVRLSIGNQIDRRVKKFVHL